MNFGKWDHILYIMSNLDLRQTTSRDCVVYVRLRQVSLPGITMTFPNINHVFSARILRFGAIS